MAKPKTRPKKKPDRSVVRKLPAPGADPAVVREVEQILARAKSGELRAFCCAMVLDGSSFGSASGVAMVATAGRGQHTTASLVLAMERAKLRMLGFVEDVDIGLSLGGI